MIKSSLGIEFRYALDYSWVTMTQLGYCEELLKRHNMADCKPRQTPADSGRRLSSEDSPSSVPKPGTALYDIQKEYRRAVGGLLYLSCTTRPDLAEAVRAVCRFMSNPGFPHWKAVKRIFRYLRGSSTEGIKFTRSENPLLAYADADYANNVDNRRSVSGWLLLLSGGPVCWNSTLQRVTAQSSAEAEYISLADCAKEIIWVRHLLREFDEPQSGPTVVFEDNRAAISLTEESASHKRTKHIDVRYHLLRESSTKRVLQLEHIGTEEMIADLLTKPLGIIKFTRFKPTLVVKPS